MDWDDIRYKDSIDKQENGSTRINVALLIFSVVVLIIAFVILSNMGCVATSYYCQI